jgi:hypothetical protein
VTIPLVGAGVGGSVKDAGSAWRAVRKSRRWTSAETNYVMWTPASGARIIITDYIISVGSTAAKVTLFAETNSDADLIAEIESAANGGASMPHLRTPVRTTGGDRIMLTTDGGTGSVTVYGYEEEDV